MSAGGLVKIWNDQKEKIVLISALLPLVWILVAGLVFLIWPSFPIFGFAVAIIMYQLSFLTRLVYETTSLINAKGAFRISEIALQTEFWESRKGYRYRHILINALNGHRIFKMMKEYNITANEIHVIAPSEQALRTYFESDMIIDDRERAITSQCKSIADISSSVGLLSSTGPSKLKVKRVGSFPLDFYIIFDSRHCMAGKYVTDEFRRHEIGLKSVAWVEDDPRIVDQHIRHFQGLWNNLPEQDA